MALPSMRHGCAKHRDAPVIPPTNEVTGIIGWSRTFLVLQS
jgi:hypothetical protein